ncbi:hypothetical protein SAMD00023353_1700420 [Rosellinia necatrix]|uniref:BZIP domain-containing protein n=1 Tax=Rosellinia necatrix TaxID=77044 RepID=A0A1S8A7K8_ROSNE|nr:hypothetical protein SAMD00023353_1700420 [Rosellinia necatrix]
MVTLEKYAFHRLAFLASRGLCPLLTAEKPWPLLETGDTNQHNVTCFHIPTAEWPSELALDMAGGELGSRTAPTTATQYNLAPQNSSLEPENGSTGAGKKAMSSTSSVSPGDTPVTKRRRVQNKLAAARCRRKAKHGEDELQRRERDLLRENRILNVHASLLREEVLQLKHEILRHSQCDTGHIHRYIQRTAEQLGGS